MKNFFEYLNQSGIRYVVLQGDAKTLYQTDDAIQVHPQDRESFHGFMQDWGCQALAHEEGKEAGYGFFYVMNPLECWKLPQGMRLTVFYQLGCHGLLEKSYIPLDKQINQAVWEGRFLRDGVYYMGQQEQLIYYLVQGVFHYRGFPVDLQKNIQMLEPLLREKDFLEKCSKVFFGFTHKLCQMIQQRQYDDIVNAYLTFSEY
jgi:hypothetical protein